MPSEIDQFFDYHRPTPEQQAKYERITAAVKALAVLLHEECPASPDRDAAVMRLREARMLANASIACAPPATSLHPCPTCADLVTHRGEETNNGACWGLCVECGSRRHVWPVHTPQDPAGALVCGHCMSLDIAHHRAHERAHNRGSLCKDCEQLVLHRGEEDEKRADAVLKMRRALGEDVPDQEGR